MRYGSIGMILDEQTIFKEVRNGNREIYSHIVERYKRRAYNIAYGFVHSEEDAMDISQDAFIKSYKNIKKFDTTKDFFPWFYTILKNLCFDFLRRKKKKDKIKKDFRICRELNTAANDFSSEILWEYLNRLKPDHREIIVLKSLQGYSYREISIIIQKPIGTVMSSLFYARKKLQELMGESE
jgi:RNA polymerase sigma-70 factor (ECF subfamily)